MLAGRRLSCESLSTARRRPPTAHYPVFSGYTTSSTRRLRVLPSAVALEATGWLGPWPTMNSWPGFIRVRP